MKASFPAMLPLALVLALGACERHSWDSTKRLYPAPPEHEQAAEAAATEGQSTATDRADAERDTSVLP